MWKIPLSDVSFGSEEADAVGEVVASGWLTMGDRTQRFEEQFAMALGAPHSLAVTNCTVGLELAYRALGMGPGDELICPSLTFVATANAALACGANVVLADIVGAHDLTIDPDDVEAKISPRTKAIVVVHYAGYPCDMDRIQAIAEKHGIAVVEDVAHAPLATWRGRALGTIGDVGCFSFFSNKNMTTGEGGVVVTRRQDLHERMRSMRSHGMTTLTLDRHRGHAFSYDVVEAGFNYRIDEMRSALGLVQLAKLPKLNALRTQKAALYHDLLGPLGARGLTVPFATPASVRTGRASARPWGGGAEWPAHTHGTSAHHILPVVLPAGADRERVMTRLKERGIQSSIHYPPIHGFSHHAASPRVVKEGLARTEDIARRELTLPLFPSMTDEQVAEVVAALGAALSG